MALSVRTASPEATQIYVKCDFSVLGDCGRHRFNVTYDTTDILFDLDYDRALAPNQRWQSGDQQRCFGRWQGHRPGRRADPARQLSRRFVKDCPFSKAARAACLQAGGSCFALSQFSSRR